MKVTMMNVEIENFINTISSKDSFRNDITVKVSADLDWALRVNLKAMNERFAIFQEARQELGQEFIDDGKVNEENNTVKDEFLAEYNERLMGLMTQKNELDLLPIKRDDLKDLKLSMPERDFLMSMVDIDAEMKTESEEKAGE